MGQRSVVLQIHWIPSRAGSLSPNDWAWDRNSQTYFLKKKKRFYYRATSRVQIQLSRDHVMTVLALRVLVGTAGIHGFPPSLWSGMAWWAVGSKGPLTTWGLKAVQIFTLMPSTPCLSSIWRLSWCLRRSTGSPLWIISPSIISGFNLCPQFHRHYNLAAWPHFMMTHSTLQQAS